MALKVRSVVGKYVAGLCAGCLLTIGASVAAAQRPQSRITEAVDETQTVTLRGNVAPLAKTAQDQGEADPGLATGRILLVFRRSAAQQLALRQYLSDVQNPHSANYRKWLTPAEFGERYGISDADLATVERWLEGHGFEVASVSPARNTLEFSGTFGEVESAFHTAIHRLAVGGVRHYANLSDPEIPAAFEPVIAAVGPLNDFRPKPDVEMGPHGHFDTGSRTIEPDLTLFSQSGAPFLFVDPADAATIYDTPNSALNPSYSGTTYDGTGVTIGIAGDSNMTMQDVTNYREALLGETAATANVPTVIVDGNDPGINGDEIEALLDSEVSGGIAPKAKIDFYTAANTDLQAGLLLAVARAIDDNTVSVLNISFGVCEAELGEAGNQLIEELMGQAAAQGISVTVSAGDSGSAGCDSSAEESAEDGLAVNGLASTPYTIAVGGTDYSVLPNDFSRYVEDSSGGQEFSGQGPYYGTALSFIPETPWNDSTYPNVNTASNTALSDGGKTDIVAGGGGSSNCVESTAAGDSIDCEAGYAKPSFQSALTPSDGARDVPDVAFLAGNGLYDATWAVCADNVALGELFPTFTDCQTDNGQFTSSTSFSGVGGTSAAAPAFAGMLALAVEKTGSRLGQADYILYQLAQAKYATVFHDVITGDNSVVCTGGSPNCGSNGFLSGFDAAAGYDRASGLGSVDAAQMVANWNSVSLTNTTANLTINGSTAGLTVTHGTTLTFGAGVTPTAATGTVSIVDTANQNAGGPLNNGQLDIPLTAGTGSATYNGMPGGTYTVYAMYGGDATDAASTSNGISLTVTPESSTTGLAVNATDGSGNPLTDLLAIPYGSILNEDALIEGEAEGANTQGLATGSVTFLDNGTQIGTGQVSANDMAYFVTPNASLPALPVGAHQLTASYGGDSSFSASTSSPVAVTIVQASTTLSVNPGSGTISSQASDLITIFIDYNGIGTPPTGTVALSDNGTSLSQASIPLTSPVTFTLAGSALPAGQNVLTATYSGDTNYSGSSASATITVTEAAFTLAGADSLNVTAGAGSGNAENITVSPKNGFLGAVNLSCSVQAPSGAANPATCSIPGTADITSGPVNEALSIGTTSSTTNGAYSVTVSGVDATTGKITASTVVAVTVSGGSSVGGSFALSNSGGITVAAGATSGNTATVTVTPANGFTGQVNLTCAVSTSMSSVSYTPVCTVPASVNISGSSAATATLSIATTAGTTALGGSGGWLEPGGGVVFAGVLLIFVPRRRKLIGGLAVLLVLAVAGVSGCGSSSGSTHTTGMSGTTPGSYTITVTGTDQSTGQIQATTTVSLTVN